MDPYIILSHSSDKEAQQYAIFDALFARNIHDALTTHWSFTTCISDFYHENFNIYLVAYMICICLCGELN